ncbi:hypothetical protein JCM19294_1136 [Nonlabens tegetincola]|uniref:Uncharacterized protein n=1 Tax=Nonlabens tegetincola TaxID=323273 RepID=A0A090Q3Q1_9FLAO|nr:hypothetical protein [Nonlabens tegetincola]GAK96827.1 hypothetical protein JCM19294_1136 [Nonlabens tegetincola]
MILEEGKKYKVFPVYPENDNDYYKLTCKRIGEGKCLFSGNIPTRKDFQIYIPTDEIDNRVFEL